MKAQIKRLGLAVVFIFLISTMTFAQTKRQVIESSPTQNTTILRAIKLMAADQQDLFSMNYKAYLKQLREEKRCSFLTLNNLARATRNIPEDQAFNCMSSTFAANLPDAACLNAGMTSIRISLIKAAEGKEAFFFSN